MEHLRVDSPGIAAEWLGASEASRRLRISRQHLNRLAVAGVIGYVDTPLGKLYSPDAVERMREERAARATAA